MHYSYITPNTEKTLNGGSDKMKHKINTLVIKKISHYKFKPHDVSFNDFYIHIFKFIVWDMGEGGKKILKMD